MIYFLQSFNQPILRVGGVEYFPHCFVLAYEDAALRVFVCVPAVDTDAVETFYADEDRQYPSEARRYGQFHEIPPRWDGGAPFSLYILYLRERHIVGKPSVSVF